MINTDNNVTINIIQKIVKNFLLQKEIFDSKYHKYLSIIIFIILENST